MPEFNNRFHKGRMNKDLDERLVPNGEYRDALNVEIVTSEGSNVGTVQNLKGNIDLSSIVIQDKHLGSTSAYCVGSIADEKNDKIYWLLAGEGRDIIAEYNYNTGNVLPVVVDIFTPGTAAYQGSGRVLNFDKAFPITGLNIIDEMLFWTDNNTEPKRVNIPRAKLGSISFFNKTELYVRDVSTSFQAIEYVSAGLLKEEHITIIKKSPPTAPTLEMRNTSREDRSFWIYPGNGISEVDTTITTSDNLFLDMSTGDFYENPIQITLDPTITGGIADYKIGDILVISAGENELRVEILPSGFTIDNSSTPPLLTCEVAVLSGDKQIMPIDDTLDVRLDEGPPLFEFKYPRFGYRYKYEDGEYSAFSPFSEVAFLPNEYSYLPKEGYNLGMVNQIRSLAIKNFVHERLLPDDVIAIDILYKESVGPNVYSVKTIKRKPPSNTGVYDEWNGLTATTIDSGDYKTKGFVQITSEVVHAAIPSNQTLRPWDNVPRKALAQEVVGNRLVYGNYLQNYNIANPLGNYSRALRRMEHSGNLPASLDIDIDLKLSTKTRTVGDIPLEQVDPNLHTIGYGPAKSIKSLRTYQLGVVYIDEFGRETPVFSNSSVDANSLFLEKSIANKQTKLNAQIFNNSPEWAKHFKFFVKQTADEYYNLSLDRWYDAEDGNIWLSFPSSERNKIDDETFLILKKVHDGDDFVDSRARYKIIAIENEAPLFIKLKRSPQGAYKDDTSVSGSTATQPIGDGSVGFPLEGGTTIKLAQAPFETFGWEDKLDDEISLYELRVKGPTGYSNSYKINSFQLIKGGAMDFYELTMKEPFGSDMIVTSPDGTFANRNQNCSVELWKEEEINKPQFEGRFFVKIVKDSDLIEALIKPVVESSTWTVLNSIKSSYINPESDWALANSGNTDFWFGNNSDKISISPHNNTGGNVADEQFGIGPQGDGKTFWKEASKSNETGYNSSGWFIDRVEGFRRFKRTKSISNEDSSYETHSVGINVPGFSNDIEALDPAVQVQLTGTNTHSTNSGTNYLGISDNRGPENELKLAPKAEGGNILPSLGITNSAGGTVIHLSYSGIGTDEGDGNPPNDAALTDFHGLGSSAWAADYVNDVAFIQQITTPNTLWRWEEDPDQILYKTENPPYSISLVPEGPNYPSTVNIDNNAWFANTGNDSVYGDNGIALYNYTKFADYAINDHYRAEWYSNLAGPGSAVGRDQRAWVSMEIQSYTENCGPPLCGTANQALSDTNSDWIGAYFNPARWGGDYTGSPAASAGWSIFNGYSGGSNVSEIHKKFPMMTEDWGKPWNKRRRYMFFCKTAGGKDINGNIIPPGQPAGTEGAAKYLPTNSPDNDAWFDENGVLLTSPPTTPAPGIRSDGMYTGHAIPGSGSDPLGSTTIPYKKMEDSSGAVGDPPGSVTWQIVEAYSIFDDEKYQSTNPAVFETEPKENTPLDIYYEVGQTYPIDLNDNTIEQFIGAVGPDLALNSKVTCYTVTGTGSVPKILSTESIDTTTGASVALTDIRVWKVSNNSVYLHSVGEGDAPGVPLNYTDTNTVHPNQGDRLVFTRADGSSTEVEVTSLNTLDPTEFKLDRYTHNYKVTLPWFNCFSFGNGVESDRIRDDYNAPRIDNGPKASASLEEPYAEERRGSGLIYSGIYNSKSGVNNLNQFIQAEKITKDLNPSYGSIQKLFTRNTNLVTLCEDKVFKILANKDALFNADGNPQLTATSNVLGQTIPFTGEFGISKNPESFASESYRAYFTDKTRGTVLRLSQDGITPISDFGMKDYFADNLPETYRLLGSFDDKKQEYNLTLDYTNYPIILPPTARARTRGYIHMEPGADGNPSTLISPTTIRIHSVNQIQVGDVIVGDGIPINCFVDSIGPIIQTGSWKNWRDITVSCVPSTVYLAALPIITLEYEYDKDGNPSASLWGYESSIVISIPTTPPVSIEPSSLNKTISFSEASKGWVSFKSWIQENGISLNNTYYTFKAGQLWQHHASEDRNTFYNKFTESSIELLFNGAPGSVKSFQTLNYEGSQSKITIDTGDDEYWNNNNKKGWYVDDMHTNLQEGDIHEFKNKEGKWFSQVKGVTTEWLDDGNAGNIDTNEFSYQGIDEAAHIGIIGNFTSWECVDGTCEELTDASGPYQTRLQCLSADGPCRNVDTGPFDCNADTGYCEPSTTGVYSTLDACVDKSPCGYHPYDCNSSTGGYCMPSTSPGQYTGTPGVESAEHECLRLSDCGWSDPHDCCDGVCYPSYTGQFVNESDCITNSPCTMTNFEPHSCNFDQCIPDPNGPYSNLTECVDLSACTYESGWECDSSGSRPSCTNTGSGPYTTELHCLQNSPCEAATPKWECYCGTCVPQSDGQYTSEKDCLDNTDCSPINPCSRPHTVSVIPTDPTADPDSPGTCFQDGDVQLSVTLGQNGATHFNVFYRDPFGAVLADPNLYSGSTTTSLASSFSAPGLLFGSWEYTIIDNLGCETQGTFYLDCQSTPEACSWQTDVNKYTITTTNPTPQLCNNGTINIQMDSLITAPGGTWSVQLYEMMTGGTTWVPVGFAGPLNEGDNYTFFNLLPATGRIYKYVVTTTTLDGEKCDFEHLFELTCQTTQCDQSNWDLDLPNLTDIIPCDANTSYNQLGSFGITANAGGHSSANQYGITITDPQSNDQVVASSAVNIDFGIGFQSTNIIGRVTNPPYHSTTGGVGNGGTDAYDVTFTDDLGCTLTLRWDWPCSDPCATYGCTDPAACNYNSAACADDGSCNFDSGCTDSTACNYNSTATCDDGSCVYGGCTDSSAYNYDATAGCDDGSCLYYTPQCLEVDNTNSFNANAAGVVKVDCAGEPEYFDYPTNSQPNIAYGPDTTCCFTVGCMDPLAIHGSGIGQYSPTNNVPSGLITGYYGIGDNDGNSNLDCQTQGECLTSAETNGLHNGLGCNQCACAGWNEIIGTGLLCTSGSLGYCLYPGACLIPDLKFEQELITLGYDTGTPDGEIDDTAASGVTNLPLPSKGIVELTGIQCFTGLSMGLDVNGNTSGSGEYGLVVNNNYLTNSLPLDLSSNTNLIGVNCSNNTILEKLNISNVTSIKRITAENCNLDQIISSSGGVYTEPATYFKLKNNNFTSFDATNFSNNIKLLDLRNNSILTTVNVTGADKLTNLYTSNSPLLTTLTLSGNTDLFNLQTENCPLLTTLDISGVTGWGNLLSGNYMMKLKNCNITSITFPTLSNHPSLDIRNQNGNLTTIDLRNITNIVSSGTTGVRLDGNNNVTVYTGCTGGNCTSGTPRHNFVSNMFKDGGYPNWTYTPSTNLQVCVEPGGPCNDIDTW